MTSKAFARDAVAAHVDRVVTRDQRTRRSVWFIVFDRSVSEAMVHLPVDEIPLDPTDEECRYIADFFADTAAHLGVAISMAVVVTRPGATAVSAADRRWYRAVRDACAQNVVPLLGVHLLTPNGSRELVLDDVM
jgi:hypothetical protein